MESQENHSHELDGSAASFGSHEVEDDNILNSGHPGHITAGQAKVFDQLRSMITNEQLDQIKYEVESYENVLCRYLRARKFNLEASATMIAQSIDKQAREKPAGIMTASPESLLDCTEDQFKKWYPHYFRGFDKHGRPVLYDQVGKMDLAGVKCVTSLDRMIRFHWYLMCVRLNQKYTEAATKDYECRKFGLVSVLDLAGLSHKAISRDVYSYIKEVASVDQLCFPELLGAMVIINAPAIFVGVWKIIKVWLDPKTQAKIQIIRNPDVWKKRLQELIPVDELPSDYGGHGPPLVPDPHAEIEWVTLGRSSTQERRLAVTPGQKVRQEVFSSNSDVEVSVYRLTAAKSEIPLFPAEKVVPAKDTHRGVLRREFVVPEDTTAIIFRYRNLASLVGKHLVCVNEIVAS